MPSLKKPPAESDEQSAPKKEQLFAILKKVWTWMRTNVKTKIFKNRKLWQWALITVLALTIAGMGVVIGVYRGLLQNLPAVEELESYEPGIITYVYDDEGTVLWEFAREKRIAVSYQEIPEVLKNAILATEDPRFFKHGGVDVAGILRAVFDYVSSFGKTRLRGGSTITQQLIKEILLESRRSLSRKFKEWILAGQVEKRYTKEEIFTLYCNQFYLGQGAYGVEAYSEKVFGKSIADLTLEEAAVVAGVFRSSLNYDPYKKPELTTKRRNHVLNRMFEEGYISKLECESAKNKPLEVKPRVSYVSDFAGYFIEEVRKHLYATYGERALYREGLKVYTTLNRTYQEYAEIELKKQLRVLDKSQGWRPDKPNLIEMGVENWQDVLDPIPNPSDPENERPFLESWRKSEFVAGDILEAVVLSVDRAKAVLKLRDFAGKMGYGDNDRGWTKKRNLSDLIKEGDIIRVRVVGVDVEKKEIQVTLDQEPKLEGAFLAIDPHTGQIKVMVGGYSFKRLKFNQTTQAMRQSGSVIKPFLYVAAIENGILPTDPFVDEPTEFYDKWTGQIYSPPNYDETYKGAVTLRQGLEESRNIVTVKVLDAISPQVGVDYVKKFGVTSEVYPYLSLALGAFEIKMIELVSAFSTFPNKGVRIEPYFISRVEDKNGNILEDYKIESYEVISPQIAYLMTTFLRGVVTRGTAWPAASVPLNLCGKTGTTDNWADAWFMGFSPSLTAGVWIGNPEGNISIGKHKSGMVAALPPWQRFFSRIAQDEIRKAEERGEKYVPEDYDVPPYVDFVEIDRRTGLLANPFVCSPKNVISEVFLPGMKKPSRLCRYEDHMLTYDYYEVLKKKD